MDGAGDWREEADGRAAIRGAELPSRSELAAQRSCPACGLRHDTDAANCPRCGNAYSDVPANFDAATGMPLGIPPRLRCWHCGAGIGQDDVGCDACGVNLLDRTSGSVGYDVVPVPAGRRRKASPEATARPRSGARPLTGMEDRELTRRLRSRNYLVAHWRGQLPLGVSFWVNLVLITLVFGVVLPIAFLPHRMSGPPPLIIAFSAAVTLAMVALGVWQLVASGARRRPAWRGKGRQGSRRYGRQRRASSPCWGRWCLPRPSSATSS